MYDSILHNLVMYIINKYQTALVLRIRVILIVFLQIALETMLLLIQLVLPYQQNIFEFFFLGFLLFFPASKDF